MWRRVRGRLERDGRVRFIKVQEKSNASGKPRAALQLVKDFDIRKKDRSAVQSLTSGEEDEEEDEEEDVPVEPQFAERGFHWHALRLIVQAGEQIDVCSQSL